MLVLCTSSFLFFKALFLLNVVSFAQKFYEMGKLRFRELERICPKSPNKKLVNNESNNKDVMSLKALTKFHTVLRFMKVSDKMTK